MIGTISDECSDEGLEDGSRRKKMEEFKNL
jgi:hypothetical protein